MLMLFSSDLVPVGRKKKKKNKSIHLNANYGNHIFPQMYPIGDNTHSQVVKLPENFFYSLLVLSPRGNLTGWMEGN